MYQFDTKLPLSLYEPHKLAGLTTFLPCLHRPRAHTNRPWDPASRHPCATRRASRTSFRRKFVSNIAL